MTEKILKRINELLDETDMTFDEISAATDVKFSKLRAIHQHKNLPSLEIIIQIAEFCNCSVSFILGLYDFPDEFEKGLNTSNIAPNLKDFIAKNAPRFYFMVRRGFHKKFPSFKKWLSGNVCPNTYNFIELVKALDLLAEDLLRKID